MSRHHKWVTFSGKIEELDRFITKSDATYYLALGEYGLRLF
jgi:hypothetical protein